MAPKTVLVTGANGYIGNAVARSFVSAGWITYGLIRSAASAAALAAEEIIPIVGDIDNTTAHEHQIRDKLPPTLDAIISTTEDGRDYISHYNNTVKLLRLLGLSSQKKGVKPIVVFTSGCKDYGVGPHYADDPALQPHTEESPVNPPGLLAARTEYSRKILDHADAFFPVLVRPTNVYGRSSSYYLGFFQAAEQTLARPSGAPLVIPVRPDSVCHALHVDDCGDAYVALAAHPRREEEIAGQIFNISAHRYETVDEICRALAVEYGLAATEGSAAGAEGGGSSGLKYVEKADLAPGEDVWPVALIDFPQWTGSDKIRRVTGWSDRRPLFSEALHTYRLAYEAAKAAGHSNVVNTEGRMVAFRKFFEKAQV
ncbi:NAD dependent epimerase/dehydratase [Xylariales sp. PMI_506]|nr:NAD dependent epimerase/dehydratase [Xylariales sp. PMI_506]